METKTASTKARAPKRTKISAAVEQVVPPKSPAEEFNEAMMAATDRYLERTDAPSWKRIVAAMAFSAAAAVGTMYIGFSLTMLAVLMMPTTGVLGFIGLVTTAVGFCLSMFAAFAVQSIAFDFVAKRGIDKLFAKPRDAVIAWTSKFRRGEVVHA